MHDNSLQLMRQFIANHLRKETPGKILDVGSMNVDGAGHPRGSYRPLIPDEWSYTGLDVAPGPNVDVVQETTPWIIGTFDAVISGQCLEHVRNPFVICTEMGRVVRSGALCCWIAPWQWPLHRHPIDAWRILPDGMHILLEESGFEPIHVSANNNDTVGIGRRL